MNQILGQTSSGKQRCISFALLFCCGRCGCHGSHFSGCLDAHEHYLSLLFIFYQILAKLKNVFQTDSWTDGWTNGWMDGLN